MLEYLQNKLDAIAAQNLTRVLRVAESPAAPLQQVRSAAGQSRELLMFCSNDYLGLAAHPALRVALAEGAQKYGAGSGASHLISGHSIVHADLEEVLAAWMQPYIPAAQALFFCTGYMANMAVLTSLGDAEAEIFSDELNHASLIDGTRLAKALVRRYAHNDTTALEALLQSSTARNKLIVTDGVFSMDGDLAPLRQLLALAERYDAWLIVDDAHGFGVLGAGGRGILEHYGLHSERLIMVGTLGKAVGVAGAFVVAHRTITRYLLQTARSYIYTTASPPAMAYAVLASLRIIDSDEGAARRQQLLLLQQQLRSGIAEILSTQSDLPWRMMASDTPIQPLVIGDNAAAMQIAAHLEAQGIRVPAIRPPTVPQGTARLRITLSASHTAEQVGRLLQGLQHADHGTIEDSHTIDQSVKKN
jgi:8-amino-7-oxononanoate synthase